MITLIDNYDSFVHNLARYIGELGHAREVIRNDAMSAADVIARKPSAIIISPGPCGPEAAGISMELIRLAEAANVPLFGVCLGHQAIAAAFNGRILRADPAHGKPALIHHHGHRLFKGLPNPFTAARYHSLVAALDPQAPLRPIAHLDDGLLMGLAHETRPIYGVQFHPESVLTDGGHRLLQNFLDLGEEAGRMTR